MLGGLLQKLLLWIDYILPQSVMLLFYYIGYPFLFVILNHTTLKLQLSKSPTFNEFSWNDYALAGSFLTW